MEVAPSITLPGQPEHGGNPPPQPPTCTRIRRAKGAILVLQDLMDAQIIPADTDFRMFSYKYYGSLPGIDVAFLLDSSAYHTREDAPHRIKPGTLQVTAADSCYRTPSDEAACRWRIAAVPAVAMRSRGFLPGAVMNPRSSPACSVVSDRSL